MPERVRLREASPHVLPTESQTELEQLKRAVREALNPPTFIITPGSEYRLRQSHVHFRFSQAF